MPDILLVEDKDSLRRVLRLTLEHAGYSVAEAADAREAAAEVARAPFRLVLTDLRMPHGSGMDVLRAARAADPDVPVVVMTAYGSINEAVQAMKDGAHDFLQKPVDSNHLLLLVERALEQLRLRTENLLLGESGTGKELFARAVHHLSNRRDKPFVAINCAAIPETLIENELFGHERGAFTGAGERRLGKFELAAGGTVFLDEIGELPLAVQGKLLRAIEEKTVDRIGGKAPIPVDVRIVAATHPDLRAAVDKSEFRGDLFFRLAVFPIEIPPLRDRGEDIVLLAHHFAAQLGKELRGREATLGDRSLEALRAHGWPGNVRELENAIERACILADGASLEPSDLGFGNEQSWDVKALGFDTSGTLGEAADRAVRLVERQKIKETLAANENKTAAAEALGVSYKTLLAKIK